ncbi:MAG: dipeptide ABC transporter ATP-binding protein [Alphaproteobacteria bacterium]
MNKQQSEWVIEANDLKQYYPIKQGMFKKNLMLKAIDGVTFKLAHKKTLAIVGESGSGKSTLARMLTLIEKPYSGSFSILGMDGLTNDGLLRREIRKNIQMVFQNPYASLNPRRKIGEQIEEPLLINTKLSKATRRQRVEKIMASVGLRPEQYNRYPHMFSGGQRQRIAVARALILQPKIIVADEPTSALDLSVQAQVLNMMMELKESMDVSWLFISHDFNVVKHVADDIMVVYLGKVVEQGSKTELFANPLHPYTKALMAATPQTDPKLRRKKEHMEGELPSPLNPPKGCPLSNRCPHASDICHQQSPELKEQHGHLIACHNIIDSNEPLTLTELIEG